MNTHSSHIITIAETKGKPPRINGYSEWYKRNRSGRGGGGVAIAVREDIENKCQLVEDLEDHN